MNLEIKRFEETDSEQWDRFINRAKNATFLHTRKFYDHNKANKTDDHSLVFLKKNTIVGVLPAIAYQKEQNFFLHSHLRSTYGGVVYSNDLSVSDLNECVVLLKEYARQQKITDILLRPSFHIYHNTLAEEQDYILWKNGFDIKYRELELAIDLSFDIDKQYSDSTLRSIKKAYKQGVHVKETTDLESFWSILQRNLNDKYSRSPVHQVSEIRHLQELVGNDKVQLVAAFLEEKMIGGILLFVANQVVTHAQYIASDNDYQEYRPLNAVIDFITKKSKAEGFRYFNLGMVNEPGGQLLNEGLTRFKEGFGARGVLRETMQLKIV